MRLRLFCSFLFKNKLLLTAKVIWKLCGNFCCMVWEQRAASSYCSGSLLHTKLWPILEETYRILSYLFRVSCQKAVSTQPPPFQQLRGILEKLWGNLEKMRNVWSAQRQVFRFSTVCCWDLALWSALVTWKRTKSQSFSCVKFSRQNLVKFHRKPALTSPHIWLCSKPEAGPDEL